MSSIAYPLGAPPAAPTQNPSPAAPPVPNRPALQRNPQLPVHPAAVDPGVLDATYNAEQANLASEISQRYNDVLKNLGYMDPATGQLVMGRIESEANRQRGELQRNMGLAAEAQTNQRQLEGTLFSGRRGTEEARAQHPFVQSLADLDINVPLQLSDLYEQGTNILGEYTNRQNLLLADAARRRAAALQQQAYLDPGAAGAPVDAGAGAAPLDALPPPQLADPTALAPGAEPAPAPGSDLLTPGAFTTDRYTV